MKLYKCTADCLVENVLIYHYVLAKNEKQAWLKGYVYFNYHCDVADGGTVEVKRMKDFDNVKAVKAHIFNS